ncbi:MAG: homoserine dehydrogenase [Gammaproteobacteria bacterium]|jgi:homoserine dehydrogenase|nr:homoserine dehydrogenase [Gammaproteobacteria bacterium]MBT5204029.1 homoserine dehydrogenase [Gammaproteobacteria bacterium]MBT5602717.1 homoserine dehydrogenase [Gammaproteobacteria bacterium]MBT6243851.1 homoserine dehydrogenase [Gammaproteobacteria bacterium]
MNIGICGAGTVSGGLVRLLSKNEQLLEARIGKPINIVQIGSRNKPSQPEFEAFAFTDDVFEVAKNPSVDVLIELIGGTDDALALVRMALQAGKSVVTANKALIAQHGEELFQLAEQQGQQLVFEAAVAGSIPIIKVMRESLAGNEIGAVVGIINGTTNFILSQMSKPGSTVSFEQALAEAQELGYAEADPTFDVEGLDAAHKLTILSAIAFGTRLSFDAIYTQGIGEVQVEDIRFAGELGYRLRHLGITRIGPDGVELRVHPTLIDENEMLAQVDDVMNAVMVLSDAASQTLHCGPGAGAGPTASSVLSDLVDLCRGATIPAMGFLPGQAVDLPVLGIEQCRSHFYLRLRVADRSGVLSRITRILGDFDISIEALLQKDPVNDIATIVITTDQVVEETMNTAIQKLESSGDVLESVTLIRIFDFGE